MADEKRKTHVIVVGNQKGGVGKTTNTIGMVAALAESGRRCLIIDLDMQASATRILGAPTEGWDTSLDLIKGIEPIEAIITDEDEEVRLPKNVHLIPSSRRLKELDDYLAKNEWVVYQDILLKPISKLRGEYDYIFLDTPPQFTKVVIPAYKASDYAILAAMAESEAVDAIGEAVEDIVKAKEHGGSTMRLLGILVCAVSKPRTRLAKVLIDHIEKTYGDIRFETDISRAVALQESQKVRKTILEYNPTHRVSNEYRALAKEIENRIKKIEEGSDLDG